MWVDRKTGQRQDVAHRLLFPVLDAGNNNLQVITQAKVVRVLFDEDNKATGLEYQAFGSNTITPPSVIKATRLVVVASGAFGSPQILQRSGIGQKDHLSKLGIKVVSDLPGVGTNYQDHQVIFYPYISTANASETLDGIVSGRLTVEAALQQKAATPERYVLGWNGFDCVGKIRPSPADEVELGSELRQLWQRDFKLRPERPLMLMSSVAAYVGDHSLVPAGQYFSLGPYTPYPYSRGSIYITSPLISDTPNFDGGFLDHPADLQKLVWGYKKQRDIARRMDHYRGVLQVGHPTFVGNSKAGFAFVDEKDRKLGHHVAIEYSKDDDDAIETFIRQNVGTAWHSLGTCAMKPRERLGVVNGQLNVHGVRNLKVVGKFS